MLKRRLGHGHWLGACHPWTQLVRRGCLIDVKKNMATCRIYTPDIHLRSCNTVWTCFISWGNLENMRNISVAPTLPSTAAAAVASTPNPPDTSTQTRQGSHRSKQLPLGRPWQSFSTPCNRLKQLLTGPSLPSPAPVCRDAPIVTPVFGG